MPDDTIHGRWISLFIVKCTAEAVSVNSIRLIEKVFVVEFSQYGVSITLIVLPHDKNVHAIMENMIFILFIDYKLHY